MRLASVVLRRGACLLLAALASAAAAQSPTNRDQSHYTELKPEGFPIRTKLEAVPAAAAKLRDDDVVIGVVAGGEARAYPVNLMWEPENEVLNDTLGDVAIAATWCPVAHSAAVYSRALGGQEVELGAVGLRNGVFILYDSGTRSWWSQVAGTAVQGSLAGQALDKRPSLVTTWAAWRRLHPATTVFWDERLPGRRRFTEDSMSRITFGGAGPIVNADLVLGVDGPRGGARGWLLRALAATGGLVNDTLDGVPLLVSLDADGVTARARKRVVDGRVLTLEAKGALVVDRETGSTWDIATGRAVAGPLAGRVLEALVHTPALWYAWRSERPHTTLWTGAE